MRAAARASTSAALSRVSRINRHRARYVSCLDAFARQTSDVNVALTSIGMMLELIVRARAAPSPVFVRHTLPRRARVCCTSPLPRAAHGATGCRCAHAAGRRRRRGRVAGRRGRPVAPDINQPCRALNR